MKCIENMFVFNGGDVKSVYVRNVALTSKMSHEETEHYVRQTVDRSLCLERYSCNSVSVNDILDLDGIIEVNVTYTDQELFFQVKNVP